MVWRQRVQGVVIAILVLGALAVAAGASFAPSWTDSWTDLASALGW